MKVDYDLIAEKWSKCRTELPAIDAQLFGVFIAELPRYAQILDLGCGSGIPIARKLAEAGFSVTGIDGSEKLLREAKKSVPGANFITANIEDFSAERTYDGVVLWDSIIHLPRAAHGKLIENIYNALSSDGLLILSSGGSEQQLPAFTDFMFGVEFFYDSLPPAALIKLCEKIGFTVAKYAVVNEPDGERDKGRVGIILKKASTID